MMKRLQIIVMLVALAALLLSSSALAATKLRLAVAGQPMSALMHIAVKEGFFKAEGLEVDVTTHISGKRALLDGLFAGKADVATTSDVPLAFNAFKRNDFRAVAAINFVDNTNRIVARKDAGIQSPEDLKGKRIATQKSSAVHYFMYLFLLKHGMLDEDVQVSYMKGNMLPKALANNEIDAFSMREPYVGQAVELLGDNAVVFAEPGLFPQFDLVLVKKDIAAQPELLESLVKGLLKAEQFAKNSPVKAMRDVADTVGTSPERIKKLWQDYQLNVHLPQALLLSLESEAAWIMDSGFVSSPSEPDMLKLIETAPLMKLKPEAVSIIK